VKEPLLSTFAGRILNLHPAPLPRFRGPDPLYWQLVLGEPHGAVSVHYVTPEIDGGHLLAQERFAIEPGETERGLKRAVDRVAPRVLADAIERARTGDPGDPQNACDATYQKSRPKGIAACFPRRPRHPRRHDLAERATR
jgi:methionyl-tRNA formyltransferase